MNQKFLALIITVFLNAAFFKDFNLLPSTDSDIYIYGKVFTDDDEIYTGQIRWGKEEAYWFDFFNSNKPENTNLDYLTKSERKALREHHNYGYAAKGLFGWDNNYGNEERTHLFACQFGNLKSINIGSRDRVVLEFKNGSKIKLKGGSNDIETFVQVTDKELGHIKIEWDRIDRVEFINASQPFESYHGDPLYGNVQTEGGASFTGYVQWDHDERFTKDELNGKNKDGELDLLFGNIQKIEKSGRGSKITTRSGRTIALRGTNDVNDENRGIIVNIHGQGRVDIPWDEFKNVTFTDSKKGVISYSDFDGYHHLSGSVSTTDGQVHQGRIIYDLDEEYQLEILNGKIDDIEYFIPFHLVQKITPSSHNKSRVTLKSGTTLTLEDSVDVNDENDGVLIFTDGDNNPTYVAWDEIEEIKF